MTYSTRYSRYKLTHPDRVKQAQRNNYLRNRAKRIAYAKAYYGEHKKRLLAQRKAYYKKHPEIQKARIQRYLTKLKHDPGRYEKRKQYQKEYGQTHRDRGRISEHKYRERIKLEVYSRYGGKCACCSESNIAFLAIDHINGGGRKHLKAHNLYSGGAHLWAWLRRNNYPDGFQVLCHNCNHAKHVYKICPHQN